MSERDEWGRRVAERGEYTGDAPGECVVCGGPAWVLRSALVPRAYMYCPQHRDAPVDPPERVSERSDLEEMQVVSLCERFGYGRVMQIAADAWAELDPIGALTVGPCRCYVEEPVERVSEASALREALEEIAHIAKHSRAPFKNRVHQAHEIARRALEDTKGET